MAISPEVPTALPAATGSEISRGEALAPALRKLTAPGRVSTRRPDRIAYARDLWPRGLLGLASGQLGAYPPEVVVWPETVAEVQAIVKLAVAERVPIVPFGAGSGVCGGTLAMAGGMVVDLKRMRRVVQIDRASLTATFEAGILGEHLEHELARRGFTLGHFPSSIMCSTLGGWLAARSAGQFSSRYGKIEDMVRSVELVDGRGEVIDTARGRDQGIDLTQLLVGSEGTLGIFTRAKLAIRLAPEARLLRGFAMPRVATGCEAIRRVMQRGLRPSVVRLYDELDTMIALGKTSARDHRAEGNGAFASSLQRGAIGNSEGGSPDGGALEGGAPEGGAIDRWLAKFGGREGRRALGGMRRALVGAALSQTRLLNRAVDALLPRLGRGCLLIVGCEGDAALAEAEAKAVFREVEAAGGKDLGPEPGEHWLRHRYDVSFKLSRVFEAGAFGDTMEVAVSWERLLDLYRVVREAVAPLAFIMAHFSHAYADGCSIYFTFAAAAPTDLAEAEQKYDAIWRAALSAVTSVGATISHHHGVGLAKAAFMPSEHGASMAIFRGLKEALDPHAIFNPGKMGL